MAEIPKELFKSLSPRQRGWAVYMFGSRQDQPNVPNERNPYLEDTKDWHEWNAGQHEAVLVVQDSDDA